MIEFTAPDPFIAEQSWDSGVDPIVKTLICHI